MEDLEREYASLEREMEKLSSDFDKQKTLFNRALKILFSMLETDYPVSVTEIAWSEPSNLADAKQILTQLERGYRAYTMERERLANAITGTLKSWVDANRNRCDRRLAEDLNSVIAQLETSEDALSSLADVLEHIFQHAEMVSPSADVEATDVVKPDSIFSTPTELIIAVKRIVDLIPLEQQHRLLVSELAAALNERAAPDELVKRLQSIVELLEQRQDSQVDQVADFLKSMASRLADLQKSLQASYEESAELEGKEGRQADSLSESIEQMRSGIEDVTDLDELKSMVTRQLDGLASSFSDFKQSREARIRFMQAQYKQLREHLTHVESDACTAHTQIDLERKRALTDHLTGLPNRRAYEERLRSDLGRLERYSTPFSIMVIDIDHFKHINDSLGHLIGDRALKLVAQVLCKVLRSSDFIARYGGEEFVVLLAGVEAENALKGAEKLRRAIERAPFKYEGKLVPIHVSVGVTQARADDSSARLFHRADKALYNAKEGGRNRVEYAD